MILRAAPGAYSASDQAAMREAMRRADAENLKSGRDIELVSARLILTAPDGGQWVVKVDNSGNLSAAGL